MSKRKPISYSDVSEDESSEEEEEDKKLAAEEVEVGVLVEPMDSIDDGSLEAEVRKVQKMDAFDQAEELYRLCCPDVLKLKQESVPLNLVEMSTTMKNIKELSKVLYTKCSEQYHPAVENKQHAWKVQNFVKTSERFRSGLSRLNDLCTQQADLFRLIESKKHLYHEGTMKPELFFDSEGIRKWKANSVNPSLLQMEILLAGMSFKLEDAKDGTKQALFYSQMQVRGISDFVGKLRERHGSTLLMFQNVFPYHFKTLKSTSFASDCISTKQRGGKEYLKYYETPDEGPALCLLFMNLLCSLGFERVDEDEGLELIPVIEEMWKEHVGEFGSMLAAMLFGLTDDPNVLNMSDFRKALKNRKHMQNFVLSNSNAKGRKTTLYKNVGIARMIQTLCFMNRIAMTFATFHCHRTEISPYLYGPHAKDFSEDDVLLFEQQSHIVNYYLGDFTEKPQDLASKHRFVLKCAHHMMKILHGGLITQSILILTSSQINSIDRVPGPVIISLLADKAQEDTKKEAATASTMITTSRMEDVVDAFLVPVRSKISHLYQDLSERKVIDPDFEARIDKKINEKKSPKNPKPETSERKKVASLKEFYEARIKLEKKCFKLISASIEQKLSDKAKAYAEEKYTDSKEEPAEISEQSKKEETGKRQFGQSDSESTLETAGKSKRQKKQQRSSTDTSIAEKKGRESSVSTEKEKHHEKESKSRARLKSKAEKTHKRKNSKSSSDEDENSDVGKVLGSQRSSLAAGSKSSKVKVQRGADGRKSKENNMNNSDDDEDEDDDQQEPIKVDLDTSPKNEPLAPGEMSTDDDESKE